MLGDAIASKNMNLKLEVVEHHDIIKEMEIESRQGMRGGLEREADQEK